MQFIMSGFTPDEGFRVFSFNRVGNDYARTRFTLRADLSLIGKYGISMQELPLLMKEHLESGHAAESATALVFTEEAMRACAEHRAAGRSAAGKKPNRVRPHSTQDDWKGRAGTGRFKE